ncbi:MAG: transcriptional repressor [Fibrobacterales bacterium]
MKLAQAEIQYKEYLSKNKMFFTKERALILQAVLNQEGHFSVDELDFEMQKSDKKASRATLYRSINNLVDAGILIEADFGHGHIHYEIAGSAPHEHLVCNECGKVTEVKSPKILNAIESLSEEYDFAFVSHKSTIFGICKKCQG